MSATPVVGLLVSRLTRRECNMNRSMHDALHVVELLFADAAAYCMHHQNVVNST